MKNRKRIHEYTECVGDLLESDIVLLMDQYRHHKNITCLEHSVHVSYSSFLLCKLLSCDYRSAARGALLHDLFLYDWRTTRPEQGLHAFAHPLIALENANKHFTLNEVEQDIIVKHMWPVTAKPPRFKESFIVSCVDKHCALMEIISPEVKRIPIKTRLS